MLITLAELKIFLKITDATQDDQLNQALNNADGFIEDHVGYSLNLDITLIGEFCGDTNEFYLKRRPINAISDVKYYEDEFNPVYTDYNTSTDQRVWLEKGLLKTREYIGPFVKITYSAGYDDSTAPEGLKAANLEIAATYFKKMGEISMNDLNSESVDGDQISFKGVAGSISDSSLAILDKYISYDFSS